jgi:hypothetical protein
MNSRSLAHSLLSFITAGPPAGGLEISDTAMRFASSMEDGVFTSVRLEPDVFSEGKIKNEAAFRAALRELRKAVLGKKASSTLPINVVVSLSSINIYSQVFSLPPLEGENLEKAVDLNIKMALPSGSNETYSGWQTLRSGDSKIEVFSAFFDKALADDLTSTLRAEHFSPIAIEPRALSIARAIKTAASGFDPKVPVIALSADTSGIDVAIVRNGNLHFDYFHSWKDLGSGEKEITVEMFSATLVRSLQQILNFYNSHWKEPLGKILVAATGMQAEILAAIKNNFEVKAEELVLQTSPPITAEWFVAFGSALRGRIPRRDDAELSILGVGARDLFLEEQADNFLRFWRMLIPASLSFMILVFVGSWFFAHMVLGELRAKSGSFVPASQEEKDAALLRSKAAEFNRSVDLLAAAERSTTPKSPALAKLIEIAVRRDIQINRIVLAENSPVTLSGVAATEDAIKQFKDELVLTPGFREVNLPITQIRKEGTSYSFSVSFLISG